MLAALTLAAGGVASSAAAPAETDTVHIANFTFSGTALSARAGTTVTWVNDDDMPHTVVARNGASRSKALTPCANESRRFRSSHR